MTIFSCDSAQIIYSFVSNKLMQQSLEKEYEGAEHNKELRADVHAQHSQLTHMHTIPRQDCRVWHQPKATEADIQRQNTSFTCTNYIRDSFIRSETKHKPSLLTVQQHLLSLFFCHDCSIFCTLQYYVHIIIVVVVVFLEALLIYLLFS